MFLCHKIGQISCCWELLWSLDCCKDRTSSAITTSHQKRHKALPSSFPSLFVDKCNITPFVSLIIFFIFHPLISLLHLQSIYILWVEHRNAISSNSTVTFFIILPELLKPALHWGHTESRTASSHSRTLKSGFPFLSQSSIYPVLKSSILSSEGSYLLNTYLSSRRRNKFCSALDLVFDGCFSFVRNLQHFTRFCMVCPNFVLCLPVLPEHLFRGGLQDIVSICHVRLGWMCTSRRKTLIPTDWAKSR